MTAIEGITPPVPDETGTADSGGVSIRWQRFGDGERTVLFVPTWNIVDSRSLRHQVDGLRGELRVITFDARGSGASDRPETGYSFDRHADDAIAVLEATGTASATVVTASRGACAAVLVTTRRPDLVERLVMIAPALNVEVEDDTADDDFLVERDRYEGWELYSAPSWRTDYRRFLEWFMAEVFTEPGSRATIDELVAIALDADPEMLIRQEAEQDWNDAVPHLAEIACPTLIIHGSDDRTADPAIAVDLAAAISGARLVTLDGLGHRPDIRRPDLVNPLLARFAAGDDAD